VINKLFVINYQRPVRGEVRYSCVRSNQCFNASKEVTERSKARICGLSLAGVTDSNPAGGMDVCIVCFRAISDMKTEDIKVHNGQKRTKRKRNPAGMSVCCACCVLSGRGLCEGPIPCPEESYRL
jgi:hypothetical protein